MRLINLATTLLGVGTALATPITTDVATTDIEKRQSVPLGTAIFKCTKPGMVAVTFDDGPYIYTEQALDILARNNMKATFFLNGDNWSILSQYTPVLKRMFKERHQIGSHTFYHPDLTDLSASAVKNEMVLFEKELRRLIGYYPTYMRPPYFAYNDATLRTLRDMGYRVIIADIDTNDWKGDVNAAAAAFARGLDAKGSIALAHDVHEDTVKILIQKMADEIKKRGLKAVTVGECLGEGYPQWYKVTPRPA